MSSGALVVGVESGGRMAGIVRAAVDKSVGPCSGANVATKRETWRHGTAWAMSRAPHRATAWTSEVTAVA